MGYSQSRSSIESKDTLSEKKQEVKNETEDVPYFCRERPFSCVECQCSISMDFEKVDFSVRYCCGVFSVYFLKTVWKWDWLEKHR